MDFINGKKVIKRGRKIIATIYDRNTFFKGTRYENSFTQFPFSVEALGGQFQRKDLEEVNNIIIKYELR